MPVLKNPKYERFAQEIVAGTQTDIAYERAGYRPSRNNAHRLKAHPQVRSRIEELLKVGEVRVVQVLEKAALTREWVIDQLIENVERAMQHREVMQGGKPTGEYVYDGAVANRALELLGKEIGMFVERRANLNFDLEALPDDQRRATIEWLTGRLAEPEDENG